VTRWHVQDAEQVLRGEGLDVVVEAETAAQAAELVADREALGDGLDGPAIFRVRPAVNAAPVWVSTVPAPVSSSSATPLPSPPHPWTTYEVTPRVRVVWTAREVSDG
jgi:hypothetical protein